MIGETMATNMTEWLTFQEVATKRLIEEEKKCKIKAIEIEKNNKGKKIKQSKGCLV